MWRIRHQSKGVGVLKGAAREESRPRGCSQRGLDGSAGRYSAPRMYASDETLEHEAAMQRVMVNTEEDVLWLHVLALRVKAMWLERWACSECFFPLRSPHSNISFRCP
jgi:hypothetical protein